MKGLTVSGLVVRDGWWLVSGLVVKAVGCERVCWLVSGVWGVGW